MKRILLVCCIVLIVVSCSNNSNSTKEDNHGVENYRYEYTDIYEDGRSSESAIIEAPNDSAAFKIAVEKHLEHFYKNTLTNKDNRPKSFILIDENNNNLNDRNAIFKFSSIIAETDSIMRHKYNMPKY